MSELPGVQQFAKNRQEDGRLVAIVQKRSGMVGSYTLHKEKAKVSVFWYTISQKSDGPLVL